MNRQDELLSLLIKNKIISQGQASVIRKAVAQGKPAEDAIMELGVVDAEELTKLKAKIVGLPFETLLDKKIPETTLNMIPVEVTENYKMICFHKDKNKINVGIVDSDNLKAMEAVGFLANDSGLHANFYLISELSFNVALKQYKSLSHEVITALKNKEKEEEEEKSKDRLKIGGKEDDKLEEILQSAPVAKIVSVIIKHAVEGRASDIHIEPMANESRVRYRVDGILQTSLTLPKDIHNAVVARIKVLANLKLDETRLPQDGRIKSVINGKNIDFRVSILPLVQFEKVVMRILDTSKGAPTLEELGFIGPLYETILANTKKTEGMLLVTGPTGSGKSTTLFSIINMLNREGVNISTLEDPIEYTVEGVNQSQVKPEIGYTFAAGLRSLLRQDPNVIMVGEVRDSETAELAVHASLTGHLVLSTLHTNDSIGAIARLTDMGVEPFLLGSTLNMVLAQRLGRKICKYCKEEVKMSQEIMDDVKGVLAKIKPEIIAEMVPDFDMNEIKFYKGKGCSRCGGTGYKGRVAVAEVMDITPALKDIIIEAKRQVKLEDVKASQKFLTLQEDGVIKVVLGLTTMEEVLRIANND